MDHTVIVFLLTIVIIIIGLTLIAVGFRFFDTSMEQRRIQAFVLERQDELHSRNLIDPQKPEFSETLIQRTVITWLNTK